MGESSEKASKQRSQCAIENIGTRRKNSEQLVEKSKEKVKVLTQMTILAEESIGTVSATKSLERPAQSKAVKRFLLKQQKLTEKNSAGKRKSKTNKQSSDSLISGGSLIEKKALRKA